MTWARESLGGSRRAKGVEREKARARHQRHQRGEGAGERERVKGEKGEGCRAVDGPDTAAW